MVDLVKKKEFFAITFVNRFYSKDRPSVAMMAYSGIEAIKYLRPIYPVDWYLVDEIHRLGTGENLVFFNPQYINKK